MSTVEFPQFHPEQFFPAEQATAAFKITRDPDGIYRYVDTGKDAAAFADSFSRMKFGDLTAVDAIAYDTARAAIASSYVRSFLENAGRQQAQVYATSPGIYNVPSSSNLLLRKVAAQMNAASIRLGLPTMLIHDLKKLSVSDPTYAQLSVEERNSKKLGNIIPKEFEGAYVFFIDDIYISGRVAHELRTQLINEGKVEGVHMILSAQMDPHVVVDTNGSIENELNRYTVDGSLQAIGRIVEGPHIPVQKTLRDILYPENYAGLSTFLQEKVSDSALIGIYQAASNNEFRYRYPQTVMSMDILEHELKARGLIDMQGMIQIRSHI